MSTGEAFWLDKPAVLPTGKLPQDFLEEMLGRFVRKDKRVLVSAGIGRDAAVIDFGEKLLVVKTDPITFVADDAGWYALQINANDIACMGGEPRWFLATLLFPQGATPPALVEKTFSQIGAACRKLGVTLCGGHTEITMGLNRPLITGTMLGEARREKIMQPGNIQVGDVVAISKGLAIEATSIIAREKQAAIEHEFGKTIAKRCLKYFQTPGLSVLDEARLARDIDGMHALHDPTEGGLNAALHELAKAAGTGFEIDLGSIPLPTEAKLLCDHFSLDILSIISSGALLACGTEEACQEFVTDCHRQKIAAEIVGRVVPSDQGLYYREGRKRIPIPRPQRDEIIKIF